MTNRRRLFVEQLEAREVLSTFYVAAGGNNAAAGTPAAPWQTLQYAVDSVKPGDTILVESGTYAGCRIGNSGTASAPITLAAAPGAKVLVNTPGPDNMHGSDIEVENFNETVTNWVLKGLEVTGGQAYGIDVRVTQDITVEDCTAYGNTRSGIFLAFSDYPTIEGNTSYSNGEHGIYDSNSGDYPTIRSNDVYDNKDSGIQLNGDVTQGGDGIITGALIDSNVIWDNGAGGGSGINCDGVQGSTVQNNLLYGNQASGISLFQIDGGGPSEHDVVVNNTIIQPSGSRWALNIQNGGIDDTALNNILLNAGSSGSIDISSDSLPGFVSNNNVVSNAFTTDGSAVLSLAQWRSATGQDLRSFLAAPSALFVNASANNYQLSATSPAIDAGTSTDAPAYDIDGNPRPAGRIDVGAYQYQTSAGGVTLTSNMSQSVFGQSVTFTATAAGSGTVTLMDGTKKLCTAALSNGTATFACATLPAGPDDVTAVFGGTTSTALAQTVTKAVSSAKLTVSPAPAAGKVVTLTATLSTLAPGVGIPQGTVTFRDGTKVLGQVRLSSTGVAVLQTTALSAGSHSLTAVWGGDSNYKGSTSPVVTVAVAAPTVVAATASDAGAAIAEAYLRRGRPVARPASGAM
jgi:parallel beta-helix repeat protein